jgi:adenylate kinase
MNKPYTFVFFGIVGSGKGTQVSLLNEYLKAKNSVYENVYAYPGGEYRKQVENKTYTGGFVKDSMEKGYLQPDFLTTSIVTKILMDELNDSKSIIFDAYPRTISQSESLEAMTKFYKREDVKIVYIEISKEEAIKRMKLRGRPDDSDEGMAQRFNEYINNVVPSMNYFKDKPGYVTYTINGEQSIEDVHKELISKLGL